MKREIYSINIRKEKKNEILRTKRKKIMKETIQNTSEFDLNENSKAYKEISIDMSISNMQ